jgi:hypothetical protein
VFDLQIDNREKTQICPKWIKIVKMQQHIFKIVYMGILCRTLKERNTKRFVQNWHSPCPLRQNGHDLFFLYRICIFYFICYAVGLLQYSKSVWSQVGTPTIYMLISCILMPENCIRSGKSCKMYAIWKTLFTMYSSSEVSCIHANPTDLRGSLPNF